MPTSDASAAPVTAGADGSSAASTGGVSSLTGGTNNNNNRGATRATGGRGFSRGGGRNNRNAGRGGGPRPSNAATNFTGRIDALKGHVYDIKDSGASASLFDTTTEEISEYIGRLPNLKLANNVKIALELLQEVPPERPVKPVADSNGHIDSDEEDDYKEEKKLYAKEKRELLGSMKTAYSIIYGQCSDGIRAKLQALPNHEELMKKGDPIGLLKNIKSIMTDFQASKYPPLAIFEAKRRLYRYVQAQDQTVPDYYKKFKSLVEVIEYNGGTLADIGIVKEVLAKTVADVDLATRDEYSKATTDTLEETCLWAVDQSYPRALDRR